MDSSGGVLLSPVSQWSLDRLPEHYRHCCQSAREQKHRGQKTLADEDVIQIRPLFGLLELLK